jgi:hypothetical protein
MSTVPYTFADDTGNIPLSQLDNNFANVKLSVDYVIQNTQANITSVGTLTGLNVSGNAVIGGSVGATGNVSGNVLIANTVTAPVLNSANVNLTGNLVVAGNATINGTLTTINAETLNIADKEIVVANTVSTSVLIDGAGIFAGSPTVAYIQYKDADQGWTTANSFVVGQNLTVAGLSSFVGNISGGNLIATGAISATGNITGGNLISTGLISAIGNITAGNVTVTGAAFAPTPGNATANTQLATTAFVQNVVFNATGALGTISTQNANNVSITGGNINSLQVTSLGSNGFGTRTISTSAPSGGNDGDIWYQVS